MAEYWHKAGKGPDPKVAKLEKDMDDYWAKKKEAGEEKGEEQKETAAEEAPAEAKTEGA